MDYNAFSRKLETISGISVTPFKKSTNEIDWDGVTENIEFLIKSGIEIIVPCGNTSEFYALTIDEAKEEMKRVIEIVNGRALVIPGIGYSVETAIELGKYAESVGADGVMIHHPIHPYVTEEGAIAYFSNIMEALHIPSIIYYKDPHLNDSVLRALTSYEKLVGVKYAINDLPRFAKLVQQVPSSHNVTWICGTAEKWAPFFWNAGAKGFTSGLVNVFPEKSIELLHALKQEQWETVWKVWSEVDAFEDLRAKHHNGNNVVAVKEAMELIGLNGGVTREPVKPLNSEDKGILENIIQAWGLKTVGNQVSPDNREKVK